MNYTLEMDCRGAPPPREGDIFTLSVITREQYEIVYVAAYHDPQPREGGAVVTHHIRYRRKPRAI